MANLYESLIKSTNAYKIISGDKKSGNLSHAYLVVCSDKVALKNYLVELAKVIECEGDENGKCRACRLIEKNAYADCTFYPLEGDKILTADVDDLVSNAYIKPLENKIRLFVLTDAENMNASAQNKILKTLEEPPKGVCILMGATADYALLPTVKSRVKRIDIPPLSATALKAALKGECPDEKRLDEAIRLSDGGVSETLKAYNGEGAANASSLCRDILTNMRSSKEVIKFLPKVEKQDLKYFIAALKAEVLRLLTSGEGERLGFKTGALIAIEEALTQKEKAISFNANSAMTVDGILLRIVEERYKWQKL